MDSVETTIFQLSCKGKRNKTKVKQNKGDAKKYGPMLYMSSLENGCKKVKQSKAKFFFLSNSCPGTIYICLKTLEIQSSAFNQSSIYLKYNFNK